MAIGLRSIGHFFILNGMGLPVRMQKAEFSSGVFSLPADRQQKWAGGTLSFKKSIHLFAGACAPSFFMNPRYNLHTPVLAFLLVHYYEHRNEEECQHD
ncbi:MAG: hypothetical protein EOO13_10615 [Chitinophagaceae bacterium]|nr:MAG: hypothetical protein EOO13_10615 [Chitinophagaceae bacterium]